MKRSQQGHTRETLRTGRSTAILATRGECRSFALHAPADEKQVVQKAVSEEVSDTQIAEAGKDERISDVIHVDSESVHTTSGYLAKVLAFVAGAFLALQGPQIAMAGVQKVGEFTGSGFIFKDSIEVMSVDDPKVSGITIFVSDFQRALTDRLSKDFFNEPSQASISCAQTSPVKITGKISGKEGEEIFQETKNFLAFKTLHVRRIFDEKKNALVYVAYSTRFQTQDQDKVSTGRYRTSICTVPLFNAVLQQDVSSDN